MKLMRVAVPKGRLQRKVLAKFAAAGFEIPSEDDQQSRRLVFKKKEIEWIFVKDGDVPVYVEFGAADAGVAGFDQLLEQNSDVYQPVEFEFGACSMMLIGRAGAEPLRPGVTGKIATKYPAIAREFLKQRGLHLDIIPLQGSVELAAVLGLATYIVDLVETGETIRVHHLLPMETIVEITPRLIVNKSVYRMEPTQIRDMIQRLQMTAVEKVAS